MLNFFMMRSRGALNHNYHQLRHRFSTGDPLTPKESVERVLGVHKDHKSKLLYPFKDQGFTNGIIDTVGVHGCFFFDFQGSTEQKMLRTTELRAPQKNLHWCLKPNTTYSSFFHAAFSTTTTRACQFFASMVLNLHQHVGILFHASPSFFSALCQLGQHQRKGKKLLNQNCLLTYSRLRTCILFNAFVVFARKEKCNIQKQKNVIQITHKRWLEK